MVKIRNDLTSRIAAATGAIILGATPLLQSCTNYFKGTTPGIEIGNDAVEKNCSTYSVENISIMDLELYHLAFKSKKGEIEHGFYRRDHSTREIDPSCKKGPAVKSSEQRDEKTGFYFLVPYVKEGEKAEITLKEKLDVPEPVSKRKTSVLDRGRETHKSYDLNELFKDNRMQLPGDKNFYFVFPANEIVEQLSTSETGNNSPEYLQVWLVDTGTLLRIDSKGKASFSDRDKKRNKIRALKFYTEEEAKKEFKLGRSGG